MKFLACFIFSIAAISSHAQTNKIFTSSNGLKLFLPEAYTYDKIILSSEIKSDNGFASGKGTLKLYKADVLFFETTGLFKEGYREGNFKSYTRERDTVYTSFLRGKLMGTYKLQSKTGNTIEGEFMDTVGNAIMRFDNAATNKITIGWCNREIKLVGSLMRFENDTLNLFLEKKETNERVDAYIEKKDSWSVGEVKNGKFNGLHAIYTPNKVVVGNMVNGKLEHSTESTHYVKEPIVTSQLEDGYESVYIYNPDNNTVGYSYSKAPQLARFLDYIKMEGCPAKYLNGKIFAIGPCASLQSPHVYKSETTKDGLVYTGKFFQRTKGETYKVKDYGYTRYHEVVIEEYIDGFGKVYDRNKDLYQFSNFSSSKPETVNGKTSSKISKNEIIVMYNSKKKLRGLTDFVNYGEHTTFMATDSSYGVFDFPRKTNSLAFVVSKTKRTMVLEFYKGNNKVELYDDAIIFTDPNQKRQGLPFKKNDTALINKIASMFEK